MAIEMLVEQIRTMPQECLIEVQNYVNYVLYRYNQTSEKKENSNLSKHFGSVKFHRDAMEIQKEMRDEWY